MVYSYLAILLQVSWLTVIWPCCYRYHGLQLFGHLVIGIMAYSYLAILLQVSWLTVIWPSCYRYHSVMMKMKRIIVGVAGQLTTQFDYNEVLIETVTNCLLHCLNLRRSNVEEMMIVAQYKICCQSNLSLSCSTGEVPKCCDLFLSLELLWILFCSNTAHVLYSHCSVARVIVKH